MFSHTAKTRSTRACTAIVGMFLAASTVTLAGPAAAAPEVPVPEIAAPVLSEAEQLAAAIEAIPTEVTPITAEVLERIQAKTAPKPHKGGKGKKPQKAKRPPVSRAAGALSAARSQAGDAYAYGAAGPNAFDCSGLTMWAYARVGESLPHSSDAQVGRTTRVARPGIGDLVFFHSGGNVYHVGLYAGGGQVFHASQPGTPVGLARIWTSSVFYGRVN